MAPCLSLGLQVDFVGQAPCLDGLYVNDKIAQINDLPICRKRKVLAGCRPIQIIRLVTTNLKLHLASLDTCKDDIIYGSRFPSRVLIRLRCFEAL